MTDMIDITTMEDVKNALESMKAQIDEIDKAKANLSKTQEDIRQIIAVLMAFKEGAFNNE